MARSRAEGKFSIVAKASFQGSDALHPLVAFTEKRFRRMERNAAFTPWEPKDGEFDLSTTWS
jgi:hypothetical protein